MAWLAAILIPMLTRLDVAARRRARRQLPEPGRRADALTEESSSPVTRHSPTVGRALIVVENAPVPADRRVWQEAVSLHRAGWDVTVLAPRADALGGGLPDEVLEGVRIRRFALRLAEERRVLGHIGEYLNAMWMVFKELRRLAADRPFDVIQACNPPDFLLLAALGQRRRGSRLIFDHHDLTPELYANRSVRPKRLVHHALLAIERLTFKVADVTLATNGSVKEVAVERGGAAPEDVFVVRNGPVLESFQRTERDPSLLQGRAHLLVYVGVMGRQDGVDHAVRALGHLMAKRQDWRAIFMGGGEMLPELRRLTHELGLDEFIAFPGFVSYDDVMRGISSADVCLAPDPRDEYTDRSTLVKIAEYMALSAPIVSYDLVESRVTAGDAAAFATGNDPKDFARLIDELLDDPRRRQKLGATGRARVEREFAWKHSERALLSAYARAMSNDRSR